ncbi:Tripartite tricarboxylate transporter TctB family protein [Ornithinimicrobium cerasi]|uniref:Tripartite tricarboxylate transporter TctB family protein n=2 Tax=Ornithinimicrobium cerasi TaxID=2248773 RepID=A0A285VRJ0_9MICO|nr:Tripartite tricarboxylate transporter TctB family protein [Ornithinimicrobium cerasi]
MFILIGGAFAVGALTYDLGTLLQMGPGYVPLLVGLLLAALGAGIVVKAFVAPDRLPATDGTTDHGPPLQFGRIRWRPTLFIFGALFFFAFTFEGLGLFLTVFGTSVLASYARTGTTLRQAVLPGLGLSVGSWVIFVLALQQRLPLVGEWLGG